MHECLNYILTTLKYTLKEINKYNYRNILRHEVLYYF